LNLLTIENLLEIIFDFLSLAFFMDKPAKVPGYFLLGMGLLMALSSLATLWVTRNGVGLHPDSAYYFCAARTFLDQGIMLMPDKHGGLTGLNTWPPGYPAMLAAVSKLTGDVAVSARWLGVILFPLNTLLLAVLSLRVTRSRLAALVFAALFVLSPLELYIHAQALSEAPCLAFWLAGLYFLLRHHETPSWKFLITAAVLAAVAWLCRMVGVVQVVAGVMFLFACLRGNLVEKFKNAVVYALIAAAPMMVWQLTRQHSPTDVNYEYGWFGTGMHHAFGWYGLSTGQIKLTLASMAEWLVPMDKFNLLKAGVFGLFALGLLFLVYSAIKNKRQSSVFSFWLSLGSAPVVLFLLTFLGYKAMFYATALLVDPFVDLGTRIEGIDFAFVLLFTAALGRQLLDALPEAVFARAWQATLAFGVLLIAVFTFSGVNWLAHAGDRDLGFATTDWRHSPGISAIKQLPTSRPIYSKWEQPIYLLTGRYDVRELPMVSAAGAKPNPDFEKEMTSIIQELAANHGLIVTFRIFPNRAPPIEWLKANPSLRVYLDTPDAIFFEAAPTPGKLKP